MHADWVLLNGIVEGEALDIRLFLVPRDQITVGDEWDCASMSGTGSDGMIAQNVFVPETRSEPLHDIAMGRESDAIWHGSACSRNPMLPLLGIAPAAPAIGAAQRSVDLFKERLETRTLYDTFNKQA